MLIRRIFDQRLAQASYIVGCPVTGEALVVDPNRLITTYAAAAKAERFRITHIAETHIHADFISGARQLARLTGAQLCLSGEGDDDWAYRFSSEEGGEPARVLHDGDVFQVGMIRVDVVHTPGHSPEHVVFLLTDTAPATESARPTAMLSGDFILVGDVGRPDLLERAAHVHGTMNGMARALFRSLRRTIEYPDGLRIWPAHGAGSACGKSIGSAPSTTFGQERIGNWALRADDEEAFVRDVLADQPEPPRYFARMKVVNRDGLPDGSRGAGSPPPPPLLTLQAVEGLVSAGACVVDIRSASVFAAGHFPGSINIPQGNSFATWAGSVLSHDRELVLLGDDRRGAGLTPMLANVLSAVEALWLIGFDRVAGVLDASALDERARSGRSLETTSEIDPVALASRADLQILDVRSTAEWNTGHIDGATHAFLGELLELTAALPRDLRLVTHCQSGSRSSIAASLLRAAGFGDVMTLSGGIDAWKAAGLPLTGKMNHIRELPS